MKGQRLFETTRWSLVQAAGGVDSAAAREALAALCEAYWLPLYWFARRRGHAPEHAQDLTQGFLARFIERHDARSVRRDRGRFRSFLLAAFTHFILNEVQHDRAQKRGAGALLLPLEFETAEGRYLKEPADHRTPEAAFDRQWALAVLARVLTRMREEAARAGRVDQFDVLKACLIGETPGGGYQEWATRLHLTEGAVKVAVHRLRRRFRDVLREEIAETVSDPQLVDDEIRYLLKSLGP